MEVDLITDDSISETDTVLTTPTYIRRFSSCSSSKSTLYQVIDGLEKRVHVLENEIQQHVQKEIELESQLAALKQKQDNSVVVQLCQQIDQFLSSHEKKVSHQHSLWDEWTGNELPRLFDEDLTPEDEADTTPVFLLRLKSSINDHATEQPCRDFCQTLLQHIQSWETHHYESVLKEHKKRMAEQHRVQRLLEALQKSLSKNRMLERDMSFILKQQKQTKEFHVSCQRKALMLRNQYEAQVKQLEDALLACREERDEFELTIDMVRKEMERMLEEMEDIKQQRLRYKNQASRLKASLEAIHKIQESDDNKEVEAMRMLLNEAERQAIDLDRECKRQALALASVRQQLKLADEKKDELNKTMRQEIKELQITKQRLQRKVDVLEVSERSAADDTEMCALQVALKAAKTDAIVQRARVYQLEQRYQQEMTGLEAQLVQLQDMFKQELHKKNNQCIHQEFMQTLEKDQVQWKQKQLKEFQKKYETDVLHIHGEVRDLSHQIVELQEELDIEIKRNAAKLNLRLKQAQEEHAKIIEHLELQQQMNKAELRDQLEVLYQQNQTLKEESLILYGKNVALARQLGKLIP
ncbi:hypothetical protein RMATCC62417_02975 [Rhizopus microsporus]|nr:hypothetical protein RMATCC62417_02975 [Rhizopus microsporus]